MYSSCNALKIIRNSNMYPFICLIIYLQILYVFNFQTPGRVGSQSSDSDSSAIPGNTVDVNNESSSEVPYCNSITA